MTENNFFKRIKENLPERFWRFLIIGLVIYSFFVVGKVIYENYQQNKIISEQKKEITNLKDEIELIKSNIVYFKTDTYKEKVARGKLRYALPGETVVFVPYDTVKGDQNIEENTASVELKRPNYQYWMIYFFGS